MTYHDRGILKDHAKLKKKKGRKSYAWSFFLEMKRIFEMARNEIINTIIIMDDIMS